MIAERIKLIRKQKGMTQKQLAEQCGMATGAIQQYELGKREPRQEQLQKIAEILDVDIFALIGKAQEKYTIEQIIDAIVQADDEIICAIQYGEREGLEDVLKDYLH